MRTPPMLLPLASLLMLIAWTPGRAEGQDLPPTFLKEFLFSPIATGGETLLGFTINNMAGVGISDIAFTDTLPAGLLVNLERAVIDTCGGTLTATPGTGVIIYTGGTVGPNLSCEIEV